MDTKHQEQLKLFKPESMLNDPGPAVKAAMREADRKAQAEFSMSRDHIVDAMNQIAEDAGITCNGKAKKVTIAIYNKWLSASEKHHIPLRMLPVFCRAVSNIRPIEVYAGYFGSVCVVDVSEMKKLQWADIEIKRRKLQKEAKKLAVEVGL